MAGDGSSDEAQGQQGPDPGDGLGATGTTADQMSSGERNPGTTYGDPTGTGTAEQDESTAEAGDTAAAGVEEAEK